MKTETTDDRIRDKNIPAASTWSSGGRAYDTISQGVAEGIRHCVLRLAPRADEQILDIATGTGLTARIVARSGAAVVGVDIAQGLLDAARELAAEEGLSIEWRLGDAERLPFEDASFDAAVSTFGIMFASDQQAAIDELARVVRPGGRIAIAAWLPDSTAVDLRKVIAAFMPPAPQPAPPSPFVWGDPEWLQDVLGEYFDIACEAGELTHRADSAAQLWEAYAEGFGPIRATVQVLDDERRGELRSAFETWLEDFATGLGIALNYRYLVTVGTRKRG